MSSYTKYQKEYYDKHKNEISGKRKKQRELIRRLLKENAERAAQK